MKALVCSSYGPPENLSLQEIEKPSPTENEVLVKLMSAGLNFPDTLTIYGKDQYGLTLPFVPCREYSGVVEEVGSNITKLKVGDRVMVDVMQGALQEYACSTEENTHKIPDSMSFEDASVFLITYGTAYHALMDRGNLQKGEKLAILGASGGVGSAAVQIGKIVGAEIIACVGSEDKMKFSKNQGAHHCINYSGEDLKHRLKEITSGNGVDVICDMIGGTYSNPAFRALSWNGRHLIVGFASGKIATVPLNIPLLKGASLVGVFFSTFCKKFPHQHRRNTEQLLEWYNQGLLKPLIYKKYPFIEAKNAFNDIINRKVQGKISIII